MGLEETFYYVMVCEKHAKGKIGYAIARNDTYHQCQVTDCSECANWVIIIGSEY